MAKKLKGSRSLWFYVFVALAIILIAALLYIPVPVEKPHPEDLSPYIYLVALAAGLFAFFKTRAPHKYLFIPAFALLGFLEEISWGAEWGLFKPFYWNGFKIYDIHNILPSVFRAVRHALGLRFWNAGMLEELLLIDLLILALLLILLTLVRRIPKGKDFRTNFLKLILAFSIVPSAAALLRLLSLPSAGGLSFSRASMDASMVLVLVAAAWALVHLNNKKVAATWVSRIDKRLSPLSHRFASWFLAITLLLGFVYQVIASTRSLLPERVVLFDRLNPIAIWVFTILVLVGILIFVWQSRFPHPGADAPRPSLKFFRDHPAFVFVVFAGVWLFTAQMIDRGVIVIRPDLPNFWIKDWGLWIEELLEMTSAVELVAAAFFFSRRAIS